MQLPAEARADGVFLVAVAVHLQLAIQAPVLVQLDLTTQTAVPLAVDIDAVLFGNAEDHIEMAGDVAIETLFRRVDRIWRRAE